MFVICNGMGRSGSTWQYNVARSLAELNGGGAIGTIAATFDASDFIGYLSLDRMVVAKMHDVHPLTLGLIDDARMRLTYIHRDLRDVAASHRRKWRIRATDELLAKLEPHVATCERLKSLRNHPHVVWQRYEDMMRNPLAAAREMAEGLRIRCSPVQLAQITRNCSMASAKKTMEGVRIRIAEEMFAHPDDADGIRDAVQQGTLNRWDARTHIHYDHISSNEGRSGTYRSMLEADEIAEIEARWGDYLRENGYMD